MTLGSVSASESSSAVSFCSCCGAKMVPYFSEAAVVNKNQINQLISESFLTVKGAALFLPRGNSPTPSSSPRLSQRRNKHTGDLQKHLQTMFTVLRPEDTIRLAVRLESAFPQVTRYMVVVSTNGRQDTEESLVLGMDFVSSDSCCSVGLVLPLWSDTMIHLDGDGGFSVSTVNRVHVFKPVSVQAMWSALQSLHKACEVARCHNYYPGSLFLTWVSYYQSRVSSSQTCINEWNAMKDVESHRAHSPVLFTDLPTERERTERLIKMRLREIMMQKDLENVTCKEIRTELEMQMVCNLREFKEFIDNEMIVILGQMDSPTEIFDHVFLGSEWNASNLEELQNSGVRYILNVTREIDNFFPGMFEYHNIRVYDEEATNLLEYWNDTYKFITKAKKAGAKCLVHCKMGISRSASTVIAYAMKEYGWDLDTAFEYVKDKRSVTKPNPSFMKQLEEYQGILLASKQRHNKLWRSHSDSDLSDRSDPSCKPPSQTLLRSDSHNNNTLSSCPAPPSFHHFLDVAVLQALSADPENHSTSSSSSSSSSPSSPDSHSSEGGEDVTPDQVPLPRPRAATVVPDERVDSSSHVTITVPAAVPHPPPLIHILPSTPKAQHVPLAAATPLANSVPKHKLSLDLPEKSSSEDLSPLTLGSTDTDIQDLSDLTSEKVSPLSPVPLISPTRSDDNNNLSHADDAIEGRGEADGSSTHSTDSIDFFSAREKFLGLAQDGRGQRQTNVALLSPNLEESKDAGAAEESKPASGDGQSEDGAADPNPPNDNSISVRHIVTEIEAISHPVPPFPPLTSPPTTLPPSTTPTLPDPPQDPDSGMALVSPPATLQSASVLSSEWPMGSVRRATKQLEQKLKQEMLSASPRSPLHSPSNENSLIRSLQQAGEHAHPSDSCDRCNTQEEAKDCDETGSEKETAILDASSFHNPSCSQVSVALHASADSQTEISRNTGTSLHTSAPSQRKHIIKSQDITPQVTVKESDADKVAISGCGPHCEAQSRLARGSQELARIQQTLKELQDFLYHGGVNIETQLNDKMDTHSFSSLEVANDEGDKVLEHTGWHRAMELEARLRQAGLTPPSLMKRSASLAKLDCLELSANDLNDLDLALFHSRSHKPRLDAADDSWKKKQKVLNLKNLPPSARDKLTSCCQKEETVEARGHSAQSRRSRKVSLDKKHRAVTVLYNTM